MRRLTTLQLNALRLAERGTLICAYGNEFFLAAGTHVDGTYQRNTLESLRKRGFLDYVPGMTHRGEYNITISGKRYLGGS